MGFKTITIKDGVYERLASIKGEGESFSDLLGRLASQSRPDLKRFYGAWEGSEDEFKVVGEALLAERRQIEKRRP